MHRVAPAFVTALLPLLIWAQATRIACVGNSITFGSELANRDAQCYPSLLQGRLGSGYTVGNFGISSKCLMKSCDEPYWYAPGFAGVFAFGPDTITIMIGTNDSKPFNWAHKDRFAPDLEALIDTFLTIGTGPSIWLCLPPPVFPNDIFTIDGTVIHEEIVPLIEQVAAKRSLPIIDTHTPLLEHREYSVDGVHPNAEGHMRIAAIVFEALSAPSAADQKRGRLAMPNTSMLPRLIVLRGNSYRWRYWGWSDRTAVYDLAGRKITGRSRDRPGTAASETGSLTGCFLLGPQEE